MTIDSNDSYGENENRDSPIEQDNINYEKENFVIYVEEYLYVGKIESLRRVILINKRFEKLVMA